jgi:DNA-binding XRE family transcriptional regulator
MSTQTIILKGEEYVILPRREYNQIIGRSGAGSIPLPSLPAPDEDGNTPAVALARASIAREIIERMNAAGLTQAELARRARIPRETLNRILKCTRTPDEKTVAKIEKALAC